MGVQFLDFFSVLFSWVVYRCQTVDQTCVKAREPQTDTKPKPVADDWGVADTDDWGTDGADDWGTGADDWGSGAGDRETADDDWGMEETEDMTSGVDDTGREKKDEATCSADVDCKV